MPDPDPQPPQPRPVSAARWLLMLVPSVLVIAMPVLLSLCERLLGRDFVLPYITILFVTLAFGLWLCFKLGILLDKWLNVDAKNDRHPVRYGFLILFANAFISFAGCAALAAFA